MSALNPDDISEAKRRVSEMQKRAQNYVNPPNKSEAPQKAAAEIKTGDENTRPDENNDTAAINDGIFGVNGLSKIFSNGDSSLILALILILSREKADNMLILALLYILL